MDSFDFGLEKKFILWLACQGLNTKVNLFYDTVTIVFKY